MRAKEQPQVDVPSPEGTGAYLMVSSSILPLLGLTEGEKKKIIAVRVESSVSRTGMHWLRRYWFYWDEIDQTWKSAKELSVRTIRTSPEYSEGWAIISYLSAPVGMLLKEVYLLRKNVNSKREASYYMVTNNSLIKLEAEEFKENDTFKVRIQNRVIPSR